jgi:hypothetical protein
MGGSKLYRDNGAVNYNSAGINGGGFYIVDNNSLFDMDRGSDYACADKCNQLSNNSALYGGAGFVGSGATADISSAWIESNQAVSGALAFHSEGVLTISGSMIINQQSNGDGNDLFEITAGSTVVNHSTLAGTQITNGSMASLVNITTDVMASFQLQESIVWWNDLLFINLVTTDFGQSVNLAHNILEFNEGGNNSVADPLFVAAGTDYHIRQNSPAIDFAYSTDNVDIEKEDRSGFRTDAGADEYYPSDLIFSNSFE